VIVPVKVPPRVPVPPVRLRVTDVLLVTFAATPPAVCDWTTTENEVPTVGLAPPLTDVTASFVGGTAVKVAVTALLWVPEVGVKGPHVVEVVPLVQVAVPDVVQLLKANPVAGAAVKLTAVPELNCTEQMPVLPVEQFIPCEVLVTVPDPTMVTATV
jgi:hypothetical protein